MHAPPTLAPLATLGRLRWSVVSILVACAVLSSMRDPGDLSPALASVAMPAGIGLGIAIIAARQWAQRAGTGRAQTKALIATYALCATLGLFGLGLALAGDDGSRGVLFAVGGAIFALGTPPGSGRS
ncbi:MAG: hypothetical protein IT386_07935 [Deltaproteobacteria bacterium]|nr:hypothetical protein [Deltaproteobacteria bacterium]